MKIVVLGATGNVGSRVTRRAADAGHEVVAFVRRPAVVDVHRNVTTARGAAEDTDALAAAARGADAVLVSITGKTSDASFMQDRLPGIIDAVRQAGVTRLVLVSVFGAGDTVDKASGVAKIVYKSVLRKFLADKTVADGILEASGLDWTIVYPVNLKAAPALAEGPAIKDLRDVGKVPGLPTLPMDDAAAAILDVITDLDTVGRKLLITTPRGWTAAAS
jgi:uncharacterized protein YbjT (DUF2867 family)